MTDFMDSRNERDARGKLDGSLYVMVPRQENGIVPWYAVIMFCDKVNIPRVESAILFL